MIEKYEQIASELEEICLSDSYLNTIDKYIYANPKEVVFYTDSLGESFIRCFDQIMEKYNMLWLASHNDDNRYNFRLTFWIRK